MLGKTSMYFSLMGGFCMVIYHGYNPSKNPPEKSKIIRKSWVLPLSMKVKFAVILFHPLHPQGLGRPPSGRLVVWGYGHLGFQESQSLSYGCFRKIVVPPKSSILIGFSIINHPFWGTPIFGNTYMDFLRNPNHRANITILPMFESFLSKRKIPGSTNLITM